MQKKSNNISHKVVTDNSREEDFQMLLSDRLKHSTHTSDFAVVRIFSKPVVFGGFVCGTLG